MIDITSLAFVSIEMTENDRRLLIFFIILALIVFLLIGLIGMLICKLNRYFGQQIDEYLKEPVSYRVIPDPGHFKKYGHKVNRRLLYKQARIPLLILLLGLAFYIIYSLVGAGGWGRNYFGEFCDLFFIWDFEHAKTVTVFGINVLSEWPPLLHGPMVVAEHWPSYVLVPILVIGGVWYLVVIQAFLSRHFMIGKRAKTVYKKTLEGYNYYDNMPKDEFGNPIDMSVDPQNVNK
ncbi:MAG: hypothetical protein K5694_03555 [Bacilli bacterium]|nr:hypothetical protein [Bacilli bacterium]